MSYSLGSQTHRRGDRRESRDVSAQPAKRIRCRTTGPLSAQLSSRSVLRRLLSLPGRELWWIVATAPGAPLPLGSGVGLIATSAYLISRAALVESTAVLALAITGVRSFALTRVVFRYLERYLGHLGTFRTLTAVRVKVFRTLTPLAPARLLDHRSGDLLNTLVTDVETVAELPLRVIVPLAAAALTTAIAAVVLGSFSVSLAVVLVVSMVLGGAAVPLFGRRAGRRAAREATELRSELSAVGVEAVSGLAELVAWGRQDLLVDAVAGRTREANLADARLAQVRGLTTGLGLVACGACVTALLVLAIPMVRAGDLAGVYLALVPLTALAAFEAVAPTATALEHLGRSMAAGDRLFHLLDQPPAVAEPTCNAARHDAARPIEVELRDIGFSYPDGPPVLSGLSLRIPAGSCAVITGPSGAGKSSVLALLQRFWGPCHGTLLIGGTDVSDFSSGDTRSMIAAVSQHDHLFDTTVRDNLLLADPDADEAALWEALEAADAADLVRGLPGGLSARTGENGCELSGGERQRLLIARALLADRPILVLDEATAHLDAPSARRVLRRARDWQARRSPGEGTVIVTTHQPELVRDAYLRVHLTAPAAQDPSEPSAV